MSFRHTADSYLAGRTCADDGTYRSLQPWIVGTTPHRWVMLAIFCVFESDRDWPADAEQSVPSHAPVCIVPSCELKKWKKYICIIQRNACFRWKRLNICPSCCCLFCCEAFLESCSIGWLHAMALPVVESTSRLKAIKKNTSWAIFRFELFSRPVWFMDDCQSPSFHQSASVPSFPQRSLWSLAGYCLVGGICTEATH